MKAHNKIILTVLVILCLSTVLISCGHIKEKINDAFWGDLGREYLEDLYVDVPDTEYRLLIKEWSWLLGSGEEVYLIRSENAKPELLGSLTGGDDGYCPFANGDYRITYADGTITISWPLIGGGEYTREESFKID